MPQILLRFLVRLLLVLTPLMPAHAASDGRPIPGGRVIVTLADGKNLTLPQTLSGSGIRYANEGETFVFWSKGDTAFVEEGANQTVTYKDCVGRKK